jgi:DNA mismatch endonuclease (patch repair protein)
MADIVTAVKRSEMMAGIRGKDTKPELIVRQGIHRLGFRFRIHVRDLPGKPDVVLPKWKAAVFIHGCFWHGHAGCSLYKLPATRPEFWQKKIQTNQANDLKAVTRLIELGWRVLIVWECALRRNHDRGEAIVQIIDWVQSGPQYQEIGRGS